MKFEYHRYEVGGVLFALRGQLRARTPAVPVTTDMKSVVYCSRCAAQLRARTPAVPVTTDMKSVVSGPELKLAVNERASA